MTPNSSLDWVRSLCCSLGAVVLPQELLVAPSVGEVTQGKVFFLTCGCLLSAGLALAFHDGSVHIVHRLSLQMMAVFYGSSSQRPVDEQTIKRQRTAGPLVHFKAMQLSWTSLALAGIDSHGKVLDFLAVGCALLFFFISLIGDGSLRKTLGTLPAAV